MPEHEASLGLRVPILSRGTHIQRPEGWVLLAGQFAYFDVLYALAREAV